MNNIMFNISRNSVAAQIAILLNRNNNLRVDYTPSSILSSGTVYIIELGGFDMRHSDGERKIIGCVGMIIESKDVTLLKHLCVHDSYRRRGIAKSLIERALELCNTTYAHMNVRTDNVPSLHLAEDMNFLYHAHSPQNGYSVLILRRRVRDHNKQINANQIL